MSQIDLGVESTELIEAEIDTLMRRMIETDPNAMLRIEQLVARVRVQCIVERWSDKDPQSRILRAGSRGRSS